MKDWKDSFIYPVLFMIVITAVFTFLLAGLHEITQDAIALNEETELRRKILYVFNIDIPSDDPKDIERVFNEHVKSETVGDDTIYYIEEDGKVTAYAFPVEGVALWGSLKAYIGISADYTEIIGLEFISHSETPGLGGRISEEWFKEQFRGLDLTRGEDGEYIIYRPAIGGNVDAVSGATLTSNSVREILNKGIYEFISAERGDS
ncbi:MAG TPA: FMN-binding protein [Tissierellia bacterium]|nr:FMN-binding protein [Tissierellia bacterium]